MYLLKDVPTFLGSIKSEGITDVFVLCTEGELRKYRVPKLLSEYSKHHLCVHHYPFPDGDVMQFDELLVVLRDLHSVLKRDLKPLVQ